MRKHTPFISMTALAILCSAPLARADDPPERVGRVSYVEGTVSFHGASDNDWSLASLNYPVVSGNSFWTEPTGRSEVQIDSVDVRMDHSTEMQVMQLDDNTTRLNVPQGIVNIQFSAPPVNGSVEVVTPVGTIELTHPGTYHIDAGQPNAPQVRITALEGQLEIEGTRSKVEVMAGETAVMSSNPPSFALEEGNQTEFDDWALMREKREAAHYAARYVSPHLTGYEDLDNYGQWEQSPDYGTVWYPAVAQTDWAPYRYGHWAFVAPWGWTWVDDAPWGFAPFHYGRWAHNNGRWGWVPGAIVARPVYAPALVAFVGGGSRITIHGGAPSVGWVPLGPREVFHPYYRTSVRYAQKVNSANIRHEDIGRITLTSQRNNTVNNFTNQSAATMVPTTAFQHGKPVHSSRMDIPREQFAHTPVTSSLEHVNPIRDTQHEGRMEQRREPVAAPVAVPTAVRAAPQAEPAPVQVVRPQHHEAQSPHNQERTRQAAESPLMVPVPGPQIRHEAQQVPARFTAQPQQGRTEIAHPEQHTHIAPTPKGWQRAPQQQPQAPGQHQEHHQDAHPENHSNGGGHPGGEHDHDGHH